MHRLLCFFALVLAAAAAPAQAAGISERDPIGRTFGVQIKPWHTTDDDLAKISRTGFGLVRWGISWDAVEKSPGVYDWSASDAFFRRLRAAGLHSVVILSQGNPLYTGTVDNHDRMNPRARQPLPPRQARDVGLFARFAAAAAKRYAGEEVIWEIWNEPDIPRFWPPDANPAEYAALATETCGAIKQADPGATVIGPGAAAMPDKSSPFRPGIMNALARSPAATCLDAISAHDYRMGRNVPMPTPESVQDDNLNSLQWLRQNFPGPIGLVCSEWGFAVPLVSERQQAAYPLRAALSNRLSHVPLTIWYEWKDSARKPDDPESHYGLLDYNGQPKDGFVNLAAVLPKIASATLVGRRAVGSDSVYAVIVRQPGGDYGLVYWSAADTPGSAPSLRVGSTTLPVSAVPAYAALGPGIPDILLR